MKARLLAAVALVACGDPRPAPPTAAAPAAPPPASAPATAGAVEPAMTLMRALIACDKAAARAGVISFDEASALSKRTGDRADYEAELTDFIDGRCREFKDGGAKLVGARVVKTRHVAVADEPDRLVRDLDVAWVQYRFEMDGKTDDAGPPLLFVATDHGWKLSIKD
ncbi:MAG TPA: hypothetical protein VLX92_03290 [Kofleriaceae bacterium]|nr:hypothetical protein [Kofleriaceae bacterium]